MTNEEADELLRNNEWAKWSDARELLQTAASMGARAALAAPAPQAMPVEYLIRARWPDGIETYLTVRGAYDLGGGKLGIDVNAPEGHPLEHDREARAVLSQPPSVQQRKPLAEVQIEPDYWSGGHFYEGYRKILRVTGDLEPLAVGTKVYAPEGEQS